MNTMHIYKTLAATSQFTHGCVLAIGNFDGVHVGHQALIKQAATIAKAHQKPMAVLTFEPHPRHLFRPDEPPGRITPADLKLWRLEEVSVPHVFCIPFDWPFASQTAEQFIENILIKGIGASHVVVGQDFRFGQMRKGGPEDIRKAGIDVTEFAPVFDLRGEVISSTRIREALLQGDLNAANALLGWDWELRGIIRKGDQRGRELGYPTANFALGAAIHPAYGVYAARVQIEGESDWRGAAINIGIRPMFEIPEAQVESFVFDFSGDLYGKTLRVQPVKRLRSEAKFESLDALKVQMNEDCKQARAVLA